MATLAAISQNNFKRLLAYSSIAHAGFLLIGVATQDYDAVSFYLGTYLLMTFAAFFVLALIRSEEDSDELEAFDGLGKRNPLLAFRTDYCHGRLWLASLSLLASGESSSSLNLQ